MKKNFEYDAKTFVYVLCHGDWANQLIKDTKSHFGLTADYHVYPLIDEMSIADYRETIREEIASKSQGCNILFLTDLMDGATSMTALKLANELGKGAVVPGLSLELLLAVDDYLAARDVEWIDMLSKVSTRTNTDLFEKFLSKDN